MGLNFQYYDGLQPKIRAGIINEHECIKFKKFKLQDPILFDPQNLKKWLYKLVLKIPFDNKPPLKNSIKIRKNCHNILSNANFSVRNETNLGKLGNTQGMTDGAYISKKYF